jgi:hypothetical protein
VFSLGVVLYIVLSGVHPFGTSPEKLLKKNKRAKVYFSPRQWKGISSEAIDLVT